MTDGNPRMRNHAPGVHMCRSLSGLADRWQVGENLILCCCRHRPCNAQAMRMPESFGTDARHLTVLRRDIVDDVVVVVRRYPPRHVVEPKRVARLPRDRMIGARCVSTDADGAESLASRTVNRQSAAKHVNAADQLPDHRVLSACAQTSDRHPPQ